MGKNLFGGNRAKGMKRRTNTVKIKNISDIQKSPRDCIFYGKTVSALGNKRFSVLCQVPEMPGGPFRDYKKIVCNLKHGSGTISVDQYVLVQLWEFNINQGTILFQLTNDDVMTLKAHDLWDFRDKGPSSTKEGGEGAFGDDNVVFMTKKDDAFAFTNDNKDPLSTIDTIDVDAI